MNWLLLCRMLGLLAALVAGIQLLLELVTAVRFLASVPAGFANVLLRETVPSTSSRWFKISESWFIKRCTCNSRNTSRTIIIIRNHMAHFCYVNFSIKQSNYCTDNKSILIIRVMSEKF